MREKAMREVILAQLGALRADAGVELVACKDTYVGDYLVGKADALAVAMQMWQSKARIETMVSFLREEAARNMNMAESARLCAKGHDGADLRGQSRWVHGSLQSGYRNQGGEQI